MTQRYTLEEAELVLAQRECNWYGHNFNVFTHGGGEPVGITCYRCGESWHIRTDDEAAPTTAARTTQSIADLESDSERTKDRLTENESANDG